MLFASLIFNFSLLCCVRYYPAFSMLSSPSFSWSSFREGSYYFRGHFHKSSWYSFVIVVLGTWRSTGWLHVKGRGLYSVEWVKWISGVLCSRPVSVLWESADKKINQTLDRALSPGKWMYEGRVNSCGDSWNSCITF